MGAHAENSARDARPASPRTPIFGYRWGMAGLLFVVTVINYIDRQTLSALSPILKDQFGWSNSDYGLILNAFRVSYTVMQTVFGRILDKFGTRKGIGWSVLFYSTMGMFTAAAQGLYSFIGLRFLLGAGEAANNPGGAKAVSEWFPARERAFAIAIFNSGCAIGGTLAPWVALFIYRTTGSWRPAFMLTGCLGFIWLLAWYKLYRAPEKHPKISAAELDYIREGRSSGTSVEGDFAPMRWWHLLTYRQAWGLILGRFLLDPFWFFVAEWYPIYLKSRGFSISESVIGSSAPFIGAVLGNFFAGALSSFLVNRGWPIGTSRRLILAIFGPSMLVLMLATQTHNLYLLLILFAYATFAYNCCGTMFLTLPTDVFHTRAVGTVMGFAGTSAGIGTLITTQLIGFVSDKQQSFDPIIIAASIIPCAATLFFVTMVRASKKPDPRGILLKF